MINFIKEWWDIGSMWIGIVIVLLGAFSGNEIMFFSGGAICLIVWTYSDMKEKG